MTYAAVRLKAVVLFLLFIHFQLLLQLFVVVVNLLLLLFWGLLLVIDLLYIA